MNLTNVLLQAPAGAASGGGMGMNILLIVAMVAIFYFLIFRPQQKRQKEIQKAREALKVGDKIVTAGGIHGKIKEVADVYMLIEVADGVRIRVDKNSIFASSGDVQQQPK